MSELKIKGDLGSFSDEQLDIVKKVLESRGYKNNEVTVEPVGKAGDNYVAQVKRVIVQDENGTFKMIVKLAPTAPTIREMTSIPKVFLNEYVMYMKVLPKYDQLLDEAGVPKNERLRYPECYHASLKDMNEIFLLEDLVEAGYAVVDKLQSLTNEQVKSVLKNFALLHGTSYALKEKEPNVFEEFKESFFDMWIINTPEQMMFFEGYLKQIETSAIQVLDNEDHKKLVTGVFKDCLKMNQKLLLSDKDTKQIVIQQGDAWINNLMFKDNGELFPDCIMIDYQQSKPSNPALDILYMTFNCTDYQTRKEHFHEWIEFYHNELDKVLSIFGLKASFFYPRDKLDADLKRYGKMGFILAILLVGILIAKPEDAERMQNALESNDINNISESVNILTLGKDTVNLYKTKIEGVINSFIEFGLVSI